MEVACIVQRTGHHSYEEKQESLDRADPGNVGRGLVTEESDLVVCLENAETVDNAPVAQLALDSASSKRSCTMS